MPLLESNDVTLLGVVRELLSESVWLSAWTSTRTWCAGILQNITGQNPDPAVRLGSPFSVRAKDSLWSTDLFGGESLRLPTHWVLVGMDQFTRRIIGFGIHRGTADGPSLCLMFQRTIPGRSLPKYLSTDHDPLYRFHPWPANLRVLEVVEIKTVPYVPLSHPFASDWLEP
jgi:hypothetical protein